MKKVILAILIFSLQSLGFPGNEISLEGSVKSFNKKEVEVVSNKTTYLVPRNLVHLSDLKSGQKISVTMTKEQFQDLKSK